MDKTIQILLIIALGSIILYNIMEMYLSHMFYKKLAKDRKDSLDRILDEAFSNIANKIGLEEDKDDKN